VYHWAVLRTPFSWRDLAWGKGDSVNYPVWDPGFAHGLLIAGIGIFHVFLAHFAIGGGLFLVVTEVVAQRRGDLGLLEYLADHSRIFILLSLILGAISGVGIWLTIGLINPAGTSALIHAFVWGWAIEWVFFLVEIVAALIYYHGWSNLPPRTHVIVGWIYFVAAWLSLVVINGILSFQLTPGAWLQTHDFWDGLLNPTYLPSLVGRTGFAIALAGLFCLWTSTRLPREKLRFWLTRYAGVWATVGLAGSILGASWWWHAVPAHPHQLVGGDMPIAANAFGATIWLARGLILFILVLAILLPRGINRVTAAIILLLGFGVTGAGEWVREAVRKPWVIQDYIYSSGFRATEVKKLRAQGLTASARWINPAARGDQLAMGEEIFRVACANCHARSGYNGLANRVAGWDRTFTAAWIERMENALPAMPPWVGTHSEAAELADYLLSLPHIDGARKAPSEGAGVYRTYCSSCHTLRGHRALAELLDGSNADEIEDFLQNMESDWMPPFTGDANQRRALAGFLASLNPQVTAGASASQGGSSR
jgi:mono/diheme cytochrome c family protein